MIYLSYNTSKVSNSTETSIIRFVVKIFCLGENVSRTSKLLNLLLPVSAFTLLCLAHIYLKMQHPRNFLHSAPNRILLLSLISPACQLGNSFKYLLATSNGKSGRIQTRLLKTIQHNNNFCNYFTVF